MTTSQTQEAPQCEEHGYMIPVDFEQALLDGDGNVVAMVTWWDNGADKPLSEVIYALDEQSLALVPRLGGDVHVGDWAYSMKLGGRLVPYARVVALRHSGVLRIDDARPGHNYTYRVYGGEQVQDAPRLQPEAVYHCYVDEDEDESGRHHPRLMTFDEVMALALLPEAVLITDVSALSGKSYSDPEVIDALGDLRVAVCVQDEQQIQQNIDAMWAQQAQDV